ncbi:SIR2 family protein [Salinibacter ruber]|uniref:SIR2 family protein n=1 Tax=Salinibacter ruber TaxID=146919 RepID=UPI002169432C|nr:SIR2 family protein [Salinibacter ruber]MCS4200723.1 hypothetical protein [Salinibacter ruber]
MNDFRIFILGAGFSYEAGLPLASEVWQEVKNRLRHERGLGDELEFQLREYDRYRASKGEDKTEEIDFEDFLAFLDIDHALGLKGSDQFSSEGNRLQLAIRWLIAQIIVERTPSPDEIPEFYLDFARSLQPHDTIVTFNYDTLLERALDRVGKSYRLFPERYDEVGNSVGYIDSSKEEIVVRKLHGSVDWFDRTSYSQREESFEEMGVSDKPDDLIFGPKSPIETSPLLEGPQFPDDPLQTVHRVTEDLNRLYRRDPPILSAPMLLAPSRMKVLYADRLSSLFWGLGQAGGMNLGVIVIGYSLPSHDNYARRILMHMFRNYQEMYWGADFMGAKKEPALMIDFRNSEESRRKYKKVYGFTDEEKTSYYFNGFDEEAVSFIQQVT